MTVSASETNCSGGVLRPPDEVGQGREDQNQSQITPEKKNEEKRFIVAEAKSLTLLDQDRRQQFFLYLFVKMTVFRLGKM